MVGIDSLQLDGAVLGIFGGLGLARIFSGLTVLQGLMGVSLVLISRAFIGLSFIGPLAVF